ncbi:hypothetical protein F66182_5866 [Fusarium sp. NRRL 66182]|nr:hypothetical protein F66182_5866 [Fusarium sp. NRRL 66182]
MSSSTTGRRRSSSVFLSNGSALTDTNQQPLVIVYGPPAHEGGPPTKIIVAVKRTNNFLKEKINGDKRISGDWKESVERVLGKDYVSKWQDVDAMVGDLWNNFCDKDIVRLDRAWTEKELEISARLTAWRVPQWAILTLIGCTYVVPNRELLGKAGLWVLDEERRLDKIEAAEGTDVYHCVVKHPWTIEVSIVRGSAGSG